MFGLVMRNKKSNPITSILPEEAQIAVTATNHSVLGNLVVRFQNKGGGNMGNSEKRSSKKIPKRAEDSG